MRKLFLIAATSCSLFVHAQVKGLYVNQFSTILGDIPAEDSLLNYALGNGFNYLALYELHIVHAQHDLTNFSASAPLAAFINKAKTQYGIESVGAVAENYWFFENRIHAYNQLHSNPDEKFDVFNLEFEFWIASAVGPAGYYCTTYLTPNGFPCDTAGGFDFYINELRRIDSLAATEGHISETYVGWPTEGQCHEINATCDRVLLHAYVTTISAAYNYTQTRLSYFGTSADSSNIIVIFSAEPAFMGPWVATNSEYGAFPLYLYDYNAETATWINNINLLGIQWFAYTYMPYELFTGTDPPPTAVPYYIVNEHNELLISSSTPASRTCKVYDVSGKLITIQNSNTNSLSVDLRSVPSGMYLISIADNTTQEIHTRKILITHE